MTIPNNGLEHFTVPCDGGCMGTGFIGGVYLCAKCQGHGRILIEKPSPRLEIKGLDLWTWAAVLAFIIAAAKWIIFSDK